MALDTTPLSGGAFVAEVRAACDLTGLDVLAVMANALNEGIGGGWGVLGDRYGPWQLKIGDLLPTEIGKLGNFSDEAQGWAWSAAGIVYACETMSRLGARGLRGIAAVVEIATVFEHPTDLAREVADRTSTYLELAAMGSRVWAYLADQAGGSVPGVFKPDIKAAQAAAVSQPHLNQSWRAMLHVWSRHAPAVAHNVIGIANRLPRVVR